MSVRRLDDRRFLGFISLTGKNLPECARLRYGVLPCHARLGLVNALLDRGTRKGWGLIIPLASATFLEQKTAVRKMGSEKFSVLRRRK
jgi:hypothetical protein